MAFVAEAVPVGGEDPHVNGMPIRLNAVFHVVDAKLHLLGVLGTKMALDAQNRVEEARVVAAPDGGTPSLDPHTLVGLWNLPRPLLKVDEFSVSPLERILLPNGVHLRAQFIEVVEVVVRVAQEFAQGMTRGIAIDQGPQFFDPLLFCKELSLD